MSDLKRRVLRVLFRRGFRLNFHLLFSLKEHKFRKGEDEDEDGDTPRSTLANPAIPATWSRTVKSVSTDWKVNYTRPLLSLSLSLSPGLNTAIIGKKG